MPADPQYRRIRRLIERQIRRGELAVGQRIAGERELARQFGVSQMTANRAIQTLAQDGWVQRRAGSGTYVSLPAGARAGDACRTLVLVAPFTDHPQEDVYLRMPFRAIAAVGEAHGCSLVVAQADEDCLCEVVGRHSEGAFILAAPAEGAHGALCRLYQERVPFVVLGASWPNEPFPCVDSDNVGGARLAVEYLVRLGHTRIAYLNGIAAAPNCRDRLAGYRAALLERGVDADPGWVVQSGSNRELGDGAQRQLTGLLLRSTPVTAVLCAGYYLALSLLGLLRDLQLRVPDEVSIIGFDDPPSAEHLAPPLTTIRQPLFEMGERAVRRALRLANGGTEDVPPTDWLPVDLIVRGSCRRPS